MKVMKFGGSSLGSAEKIRGAAAIIRKANASDREVTAVVSAVQGATDLLIEMGEAAAAGSASRTELTQKFRKLHREVALELAGGPDSSIPAYAESVCHQAETVAEGAALVRELSPKTKDYLMSFGELLSAGMIVRYLTEQGVTAHFMDTRTLITTDNTYGAARVDYRLTESAVLEYVKEHKGLKIAPGFIAADREGSVTTLGRGGSDYTASIIGSITDADEVELWTDVDGVLTADPNKESNAFPIEHLSYEEAMELSHFGAKVIYPPTMHPVLRKKIPLRIRNTFNPGFPGTLISGEGHRGGRPVKGISSIDKIALLRLQGGGMVGVPGVSSRLFGALAAKGISVILISQASSEHSICFAIKPDCVESAKKAVTSEFSLEIETGRINPLVVEEDLSIIAAVGENMRNTPGIAAKLFRALSKNGINVVAIAQGSSELNISVVVSRGVVAKAVNALHDAFFLSDLKRIHVFLAGTGQVGSALAAQLKSSRERLKRTQDLDIKLVAAANSKKMYFNASGISLSGVREEIEKHGIPMDPENYVESAAALNLPNSIFVDCTASSDIAELYPAFLKRSISVATPNKRANSSDLESYKALRKEAARSNVKYLYETTVGAGLPVISTLNDLLNSGDRIYKIEAVLSGTLSYIFNSLKPGTKFSRIVRSARDLGLTEPDPRDDLNGMDVVRKLLILGRETGLDLEERDIRVLSLIPEDCQGVETVEEFLKILEKSDGHFEKLLDDACRHGNVLRYMGVIEDGKAYVELREVDASHPFYSLSGADNMISFTTERYKERPLVVKGPGAGTEVTAAGVFADIIRIAHFIV